MGWLKRSGSVARQGLHEARQAFERLRRKVTHWIVPAYRTVVVQEDLPERLDRRVIYIVEEDGYQEQAAMMCPCKCGNILHLNLLRDERPCWTVTMHDDETTSLHPSVWRKKGCRSHFWFRAGRVYWC